MDSSTRYNWHISKLKLEEEASSSGEFILKGTDISFRLRFEYLSDEDEYGEFIEHLTLSLQICDMAVEISVNVQFRLWIEDCLGNKLMEKPFDLTHMFTSSYEQYDSERFHYSDFDLGDYESVSICCEILRIKPDTEFLSDLKFRGDAYSLQKSGIISDYLNGHDSNIPKKLLMASSKIIERIFNSDTQDSHEGVNREVLEKFTKWLQLGKLDKASQYVEALFKFAYQHAIETLKDICIKCLAKTFKKENFIRRLKLAFDYNDTELKNRALFYLTDYSSEVDFCQMLKSDEWEKLMNENPETSNEIMIAYFEGTKRL